MDGETVNARNAHAAALAAVKTAGLGSIEGAKAHGTIAVAYALLDIADAIRAAALTRSESEDGK